MHVGGLIANMAVFSGMFLLLTFGHLQDLDFGIIHPPTCSFCVSYSIYCRYLVTFHVSPQAASVLQWSDFMATEPVVSGSIPGTTRFSEKYQVWNGVRSAS
jgi:hypothetical protein